MKLNIKTLPKLLPKTAVIPGQGMQIPKSGCPLEDHPFWHLADSTPGPSLVCWEDYGRTIIQLSNPDGDRCDIFLSQLTGNEGVISGTIAYIPTGTAWNLPWYKFIDENNVLGARVVADGVINLVERVAGTWNTVYTSPTGTAAVGDVLELIFRGDDAVLRLNGDTLFTYNLPTELQADGRAGYQQHRFDDADATIVTNYSISNQVPSILWPVGAGHAWDDLNDIVYGQGGVKAGDVVEITSDTIYGTTITTSGESGRPITFRAVSGTTQTTRRLASAWPWNDLGDGRYEVERTFKILYEDGVELDWASDDTLSDGNCYYYHDGTVGHALYRPTSGTITDHELEFSVDDGVFEFPGQSHLVFENLNIEKCFGAFNVDRTANTATDITIRNCRFSGMLLGLYHRINADVDFIGANFIVEDCEFDSIGQGIALLASDSVGVYTGISVRRNTFTNMNFTQSGERWYAKTDRTPDNETVGIQNASNAWIEDNYIETGCKGINFWTFSGANNVSEGIHIRRNKVFALSGTDLVGGITTRPNGADMIQSSDVSFNVVQGFVEGIVCGDFSSDIIIANNTVLDCESGLLFQTNAAGRRVHNNIVLDSITNIILGQSNAFASANTFDNNLYWPDGAFNLGADGTVDFAGWQALGADQNSILDDPGIIGGWHIPLGSIADGTGIWIAEIHLEATDIDGDIVTDPVSIGCDEGTEANAVFYRNELVTYNGQVVTYSPVQLTVVGDPNGEITVDGVSCSGGCASSLARGRIVTLSATPNSGYYFHSWAGNNVYSQDNPFNLKVTENMSIVPRFYELIETETPCMTGPSAPFGTASSNSEYTNYPAWKGMNCSTANGTDAWCSGIGVPDDQIPVWLEWREPTATPMTPTRFRIRPRQNVDADWWLRNNPKEISLAVIRDDGSEVEVFRQTLDDWGNGWAREWEVNTTESGIGIRLYIHSTNGYLDGTGFHTCIGDFHVWGTYPSTPQRTITIDPVPVNGSIQCQNTQCGDIDCGTTGSNCTDQFDDGTVITLTAVPDSGYQLDSWTGDCIDNGDGTARVVMSEDRTCSATFVEESTGGDTWTDDFNRADGELTDPWVQHPNRPYTVSIISNEVWKTDQVEDVFAEYYVNTITPSPDHYAQVRLSTSNSEYRRRGPAVRISDTSDSCYCFIINNSSGDIRKLVDGAVETLYTGTLNWTEGDIIRLEVEGTTIRAYHNDTLFHETTDSDLSDGYPGFCLGVEEALDDFECGVITTHIDITK